MKLNIKPLENENIKLRLLEKNDLELTLAWRNRDAARRWFKDSSYITVDQHSRWFESYRIKENDLHFIIEMDEARVGQAAIYHIDWEKSEAEIGRFLVDPNHEGKGYIKQACIRLIKFCREYLKLHYIFLEVKETNHRAIELYRKVGFSEEQRADNLIRMGQRLILYKEESGYG